MGRLTKAGRPTRPQLRILRRLADNPGASISIESRDHGMRGMSFHGRWSAAPCPTCHHRPRCDAVSALAVFGLVEGGWLNPTFYAASDFYTDDCITPAGRAALHKDEADG